MRILFGTTPVSLLYPGSDCLENRTMLGLDALVAETLGADDFIFVRTAMALMLASAGLFSLIWRRLPVRIGRYGVVSRKPRSLGPSRISRDLRSMSSARLCVGPVRRPSRVCTSQQLIDVQRSFSTHTKETDGSTASSREEVDDDTLEQALRRRPVLSSLIDVHLLEQLEPADIRKEWLQKHKSISYSVGFAVPTL